MLEKRLVTRGNLSNRKLVVIAGLWLADRPPTEDIRDKIDLSSPPFHLKHVRQEMLPEPLEPPIRYGLQILLEYALQWFVVRDHQKLGAAHQEMAALLDLSLIHI